MKPVPIQVDPKAIKSQVRGKAAVGSPKAAFGEVLGGISAMGPATAELVGQWSGGSDLAGATLNAAFSGVNVMGGAGAAGYGAAGNIPGMMGVPRYTTQTGFMGRAADTGYGGGVPGVPGSTGTIDDPAAYQQELLQTMNSNNLKLLELQALMQSNMQQWTTKSNILSADHRARMAMIEKFTARG